MAKILLAEDDEQVSFMVSDFLTRSEHHLVEVAADGQQAADLLRIASYDLIILDWEMPFLTGVEVCQQYRSGGGSSPVLMLTAKSGIDDKVYGFDVGADDYLTKPFHIKELTMRIRALLRRPETIVGEKLTARDLELDLSTSKVTKGGTVIELFPKEMDLLVFFMRHPNQIFSLEALQQRIWASDSDASPETIRVHIARLRQKLGDDTTAQILKTVHRKGYIFEVV